MSAIGISGTIYYLAAITFYFVYRRRLGATAWYSNLFAFFLTFLTMFVFEYGFGMERESMLPEYGLFFMINMLTFFLIVIAEVIIGVTKSIRKASETKEPH